MKQEYKDRALALFEHDMFLSNSLNLLFEVSEKISFGKIAPRRDGYIMGELKLPRCTSVLEMDGRKAGALMEWAKREVISDAKSRIVKAILGSTLSVERACELLDEALKSPDKQKDKAGEAGTEEHDKIEKWLNNEPTMPSERLERFKDIWDSTGLKLIATELPVVYYDDVDQIGYGGRIDILAYDPVNNEIVLCDNKTSKSVHEGYAFQCAAYCKAIYYMTQGRIDIKKVKIFHLPDFDVLNDRQKEAYKKLGPVVDIKNLDKAFEIYNMLLKLYYMKNAKFF